jgi:hypothetical protein
MERHAADQNNAVEIGQCPIQFHRYSAARFAYSNEPHQVAWIMIKRFQPLSDERCEDRAFFLLGNSAMDAGRKDRGHPMWLNAVCDQPTDEQVNDLARTGLPRRVGYDEQNRLTWPNDIFQWLRPDRCVQTFTDLDIRQRFSLLGQSDQVEPIFVEFERDVALAVS